MSASARRNAGRTLVLAAIVITTAVACQARADAVAPRAAAATTSVAQAPSIAALLADARVARERHDLRMLNEIRARLTARVGESAVAEAQSAVSRAVANLAAAQASHDAMALARYRAQLRTLCGPVSLASAVGSCPAALAD